MELSTHKYLIFVQTNQVLGSGFRPLGFESPFSAHRGIQNFVGNIVTCCLDIKQEFFIF